MTKWLRLEEAAEYLKMGKPTIYKRVREKQIPAHRVGREWRFNAEELDYWLRAGRLASSEDMRALDGKNDV